MRELAYRQSKHTVVLSTRVLLGVPGVATVDHLMAWEIIVGGVRDREHLSVGMARAGWVGNLCARQDMALHRLLPLVGSVYNQPSKNWESWPHVSSESLGNVLNVIRVSFSVIGHCVIGGALAVHSCVHGSVLRLPLPLLSFHVLLVPARELLIPGL